VGTAVEDEDLYILGSWIDSSDIAMIACRYIGYFHHRLLSILIVYVVIITLLMMYKIVTQCP